jgi:hypothetical protein
MMLRVTIAALLVSIGGLAFAAGPRPSKCVDLSDAGAMSKILDSNPAHYEKIQNIVFGLANRPYGEIRSWMRATYQVKDVFSSNIVLTTFPGQRDLSFVLDDTQYYGRVTWTRGGGQVFLIRNR